MRSLALITALLLPTIGTADTDAPWNLLGDATFTETLKGDTYRVDKAFPAGLRDGQTMTIEGYVVPIQAQAYITSFLLVQDPADCPYCGTGDGYAPTLEVLLSRAAPDIPEFSQVTVTGTLQFVTDTETWQLFRLTDARTEG
ncbi:MAG: hypothetical protein ACU0CI_05200 [Shimia sp.]